MKKFLVLFLTISVFYSCKQEKQTEKSIEQKTSSNLKLELAEAQKIIALPLHCLEVEYPNKLGQVLANDSELKSPKELRPIFYGCFDWHSSAHGYWSVVKLWKQFPELNNDGKIEALLTRVLTPENVAVEAAFFNQEHNKNFERTMDGRGFLNCKKNYILGKTILKRSNGTTS